MTQRVGLTWCFVILCVARYTASGTAADRDEWIGRSFMPRQDCKFLIEAREVPANRIAIPFVAEKVSGRWLWIGQAWVKKSDVVQLEQADSYLDELLRTDPDSSWAHLCRGMLRNENRDWDAALKEFTDAVRSDPDNALAYYGRGIAWLAKHSHVNARNDFAAAINLDAQNANAFVRRGESFLDEVDLAAKYPHFEMTFRSVDDTWNVNDKLASAEQDFTSAITIDPKNANAFIRRARARGERGQLETAIEDLTAAIRVDPKMKTAYRLRGLYWQQKHAFEMAIADYRDAVRLDTKDLYCHALLACIFASCPQPEFRDGKQAIEHATMACVISRWNDPQYLEFLAFAHAYSGDFQNAVKWQEAAIDLTPKADRPDLEKALDAYKSGQPRQRVQTQ